MFPSKNIRKTFPAAYLVEVGSSTMMVEINALEKASHPRAVDGEYRQNTFILVAPGQFFVLVCTVFS